jgi:hypothetical protein
MAVRGTRRPPGPAPIAAINKKNIIIINELMYNLQ